MFNSRTQSHQQRRGVTARRPQHASVYRDAAMGPSSPGSCCSSPPSMPDARRVFARNLRASDAPLLSPTPTTLSFDQRFFFALSPTEVFEWPFPFNLKDSQQYESKTSRNFLVFLRVYLVTAVKDQNEQTPLEQPRVFAFPRLSPQLLFPGCSPSHVRVNV